MWVWESRYPEPMWPTHLLWGRWKSTFFQPKIFPYSLWGVSWERRASWERRKKTVKLFLLGAPTPSWQSSPILPRSTCHSVQFVASELFLFSLPTAYVLLKRLLRGRLVRVGWLNILIIHKPGKENARHSLIVQDIKHGGQASCRLSHCSQTNGTGKERTCWRIVLNSNCCCCSAC